MSDGKVEWGVEGRWKGGGSLQGRRGGKKKVGGGEWGGRGVGKGKGMGMR